MTELVGKISYVSKHIPLHWWIPEKERLLLAVASSMFWTASIWQASGKDTEGASIYAFYGLGLLFILCSIANVISGLKRTLKNLSPHDDDTEQTRALLQLLLILGAMFACNVIVLGIYILRGAQLTTFDLLSVGMMVPVAIVLLRIYGKKKIFTHPYSRGILAMALKGLPQVMLAVVFLLSPLRAAAFTFWSLVGLTLMGLLRFWPSLLAYQRDPKSPPLKGLILGESGNMVSIVFMLTAWTFASTIMYS